MSYESKPRQARGYGGAPDGSGFGGAPMGSHPPAPMNSSRRRLTRSSNGSRRTRATDLSSWRAAKATRSFMPTPCMQPDHDTVPAGAKLQCPQSGRRQGGAGHPSPGSRYDPAVSNGHNGHPATGFGRAESLLTLDSGLGHRKGEVVRRRQGIRLCRERGRRERRVRPYLYLGPAGISHLAEGQQVTMRVVDTPKGREAISLSL